LITPTLLKFGFLAFVLVSPVFAQNQNSQLTPPPSNSTNDSVVEITFQDFFQSPIGPKGMEFTAKALSLQGHRVTLRGFMVKTDFMHQGQFLLAPNALEVN
jgi:hypothetical protein